MKRAIMGGFLLLVGTIWELAVFGVAINDMVSDWMTPPGRLLSTVIEMGMRLPMIVGFLFSVVGLLMMGIEYFKKDTRN